MNAHVPPPTGRAPKGQPRGGAPVGRLCDLPLIETCAVLCLRHWPLDAHDPLAQPSAWPAARPSAATLDCLAQLFDLCARYGRRPLMRHDQSCACLGADEACFAHFIATAATGAREDALLMGMLLIRPDVAPLATELASQIGLAFLRGARGVHAPPARMQ